MSGGRPRLPGAPAFFTLTFAWSWSLFGLAAASRAELPEPAALVPWALGSLGPLLAAVVLTWRGAGSRGVRALLRRTIALRQIGARWWVAILGLAVLPNAAAVSLLTVGTGSLPASVRDAELALLPALGVLAFALLAGIVEEPGWRGYALERLAGRPLLQAALLAGAGWALWHLPYFFVAGTFHHGLGLGSGLAWFLLQILPTAVLLAWVYTRTGRLVAAAVALHALGNAAGELVPVEGAGRWLSLAVLTALAAAVVALDRRTLFTPLAGGETGAPRGSRPARPRRAASPPREP